MVQFPKVLKSAIVVTFRHVSGKIIYLPVLTRITCKIVRRKAETIIRCVMEQCTEIQKRRTARMDMNIPLRIRTWFVESVNAEFADNWLTTDQAGKAVFD